MRNFFKVIFFYFTLGVEKCARSLQYSLLQPGFIFKNRKTDKTISEY